MSKDSKRNHEKRKEADEERKEKYYDANTLTLADCQQEICAWHGTGFVGVTSFLAVGEAISNEFLCKDSDGKDLDYKIQNFINFLLEQKKHGCLRLITAEKVNNEMKWLLENTELDVADAHNLAVAIGRKCVSFASTDEDICGIRHEKIEEIKEEFGLPEFNIEKKKFR